MLAGPLVGQMLADLGAEVIKVEHPYRPDIQRAMFPFLGEPSPNNSVSFNTLHRGKQAVAVDMGNEAGAEAVRDLVAVSDVVIENLSPRVLAGFGLGYVDLKRVRPDLVMASMTAAGHTGPLAGMIGYGPSTGALAGFEGLVGYPGGPPLGAQQITYGDPVVASFAANAVAAALHRRRRTGQGVHIDVSQIEVTVAAMGHQVLDYGIAGALPERAGNRHPRMAPHGCYPCSGDDEWVSIAAGSDDGVARAGRRDRRALGRRGTVRRPGRPQASRGRARRPDRRVDALADEVRSYRNPAERRASRRCPPSTPSTCPATRISKPAASIPPVAIPTCRRRDSRAGRGI